MYEVAFYRDPKGACPTKKLLASLQDKTRAKVYKWIEKLEELGPNLPRPYADVVKGKIRELRVSFGPNTYRFLYFFMKKRIVITHGFAKKTDRIPAREIERAERIMKECLK